MDVIEGGQEALPVFGAAPLNFAKCQHTGQDHIYQVFFGADEFSPQVALHTENMGGIAIRDACKGLI